MNTKKIKEYFYNGRDRILILLSLGVLLLIIHDVPFLNIFFPQNTTFATFFVAAIILFRLYKNSHFLIILGAITLALYLMKLIFQAEQLAILFFFILALVIIDETISLIKDESSK